MEQQFPKTAESQPELLAQHFTAGGGTEKAIDYWLKAGVKARGRSANLETIEHCRAGLELVGEMDESPDRDQLELQLQAPFGAATIAARGYASPEAEPILERARELCVRTGDSRLLFHVMWGIHAWRLVRGEFDISAELGAQQIQLAEEIGDPDYLSEACHNTACPDFYRGRFDGGRDHSERGFSLYETERAAFHAEHTGQNSGVTHQSYWALSLWHLGYPDQALDRIRQSVNLGKELKHPYSLCYALHHAAWVYQISRMGPETEAAGDALHKLASEKGFKFWDASGQLYRAAGLLLQGQVAESLEQIQVGLPTYRATGAGLALPYYLSYLADAHHQAGNLDDSLNALQEALAVAAKDNDRFHEAELLRLKGEVMLSSSNTAAAEEGFQQSLQVAKKQQARSWTLRTSFSLARLWQQQGKIDEARQALHEACHAINEGQTLQDQIEAKSLLDELS